MKDSAIMSEELEEFEDTLKDRYLTFTLGEEIYGIEIFYVTEIISLHSIASVPDLPDYVKGIINLRGKIIPVIDVRRRFKKVEIEYDERTCIIVVNIDNLVVGLIVDRVSEVVNINEESLSAPPKLNKNMENHYLKGIGKVGDSIKLILDCGKLLSEEEIEDIQEI